jgi:hypothetical protein
MTLAAWRTTPNFRIGIDNDGRRTRSESGEFRPSLARSTGLPLLQANATSLFDV